MLTDRYSAADYVAGLVWMVFVAALGYGAWLKLGTEGTIKAAAAAAVVVAIAGLCYLRARRLDRRDASRGLLERA